MDANGKRGYFPSLISFYLRYPWADFFTLTENHPVSRGGDTRPLQGGELFVGLAAVDVFAVLPSKGTARWYG